MIISKYDNINFPSDILIFNFNFLKGILQLYFDLNTLNILFGLFK